MSSGNDPHAVVIGAGSAGLASAAALQATGLSVTVLEQGNVPGQRWRDRPDGLRLNTVRRLSRLPGLPIPSSCGTWPRGTDLADYLARYAEHHDLRVRFDCQVSKVDRADPWSVTLADGERMPADVVVVATGWAARPHVPAWPGAGGYTGRLLHAADYRSAEPFAGRSVLVVGSGNSATEIAVELLGTAAEVHLSVRTPPLLIPSDPLLQYFGALFSWLPASVKDKASLSAHRRHYDDLAAHGLPTPPEGAFQRFTRDYVPPTAERGLADAVRSGRLTVTAAVGGFAADAVRLADGRELRPDVVIAGTGYRPAFADLAGHLGVLDEHGRPSAAGADGLFFVGEPSLRGDLRMHGSQARRLTRAVRNLTGSHTERTNNV